MKKLTNPTKYFFEQAEQQNNCEPIHSHEIDKLVKKLVNLEKCPLCNKKYVADFKSLQAPRILIHCGHTFCHECLSQFYTKRRVRCPMCLKLVKHLDSLEQLPINHTIFAQLLEKQNQNKNQNNITNNQKKISAKSLLFGEFQRAQKQALISKMPPRFDQASGLPFCPFHQDRVEHFYCETHRATGCRICSEVGHNSEQCTVTDLYLIEDPRVLRQIFGNFAQNQPQANNTAYDLGREPQPNTNILNYQTILNNNDIINLDDDDDDNAHYSI